MLNQPEHKKHFWRFRCGHVGGEVVVLPNSKRRMLLLYEQSQETEPSYRLPLRGRLRGTAYDLHCTLCGDTRDWPGGNAAPIEKCAGRAIMA